MVTVWIFHNFVANDIELWVCHMMNFTYSWTCCIFSAGEFLFFCEIFIRKIVYVWSWCFQRKILDTKREKCMKSHEPVHNGKSTFMLTKSINILQISNGFNSHLCANFLIQYNMSQACIVLYSSPCFHAFNSVLSLAVLVLCQYFRTKFKINFSVVCVQIAPRVVKGDAVDFQQW